ncbi:hypothetical protein VTP01DRAFT_5305 [Rhizomucor pusillus]|uniref:uncharacterized protein n=1 Tax=Rhizomucor pusillus TaxID=4840 RepID=UPI0037434EA2
MTPSYGPFLLLVLVFIVLAITFFFLRRYAERRNERITHNRDTAQACVSHRPVVTYAPPPSRPPPAYSPPADADAFASASNLEAPPPAYKNHRRDTRL